jgi:predicted kinase
MVVSMRAVGSAWGSPARGQGQTQICPSVNVVSQASSWWFLTTRWTGRVRPRIVAVGDTQAECGTIVAGATDMGAPTMLIIFAGLPASGKSTIARALARERGAVWLRIDSIEQAIRESGVVAGSLDDAGYRAAYAVAEDNLRLGRVVIGDPVNPWMLTRNAWRDTGLRVGARVVEIETVCSDVEEHRHRVDTRAKEVPGLISDRDYHTWDRDHVTIDTAGRSVASCVELIRATL